jgi:hypothetical protein
MGAEEKEDIFVVWCWCDVGSVGRKRCGEGEGLWGYLWAVEVWVGDGSGLKGIVGLLVLFSGAFLGVRNAVAGVLSWQMNGWWNFEF